MSTPICVIAGAGPGNGLSFARKFTSEGHRVALLARQPDNLALLRQHLPNASVYECDVTQAPQIETTFTAIGRELGPVNTLIYNAGASAFGSLDEISAAQLEAAWRVNTWGFFSCVKQVLPDLREAGHGTVIVIGATASLRGGEKFAAFASAKGAQHNLAQSMARHLGPEGIHVAYVIIDGAIDQPRTREFLPDKGDEFFLNPDHIADAVYYLAEQPRSAWTFELDLRPFKERW